MNSANFKLRAVLRMGLAFGIALFATAAADAQISLFAPSDYQVEQRTNLLGGLIRVAGVLPLDLHRDDSELRLEARLLGGGLGFGERAAWRPVTLTRETSNRFRGWFPAPAGGWYRLEVRARRGDITVATSSMRNVGVGEVFVVAGQSNAANHGEEKQRSRSNLAVTFNGRDWQLAVDPQPGASGSGGSFLPPFADAIATQFNVPVGLVALGVGATSVREWLPAGTRFPNPPTLTGNVRLQDTGEWESAGNLFTNLADRLQKLGPGGCRALLWHQGESDANQRDPSRTLPGDLYRKFLEQIIRESRRAAGWEMPWFVAQVSYHAPEDPGSPDIRAAQAALWKSGLVLEGPDSDALTGDLRDAGGKGVHFSGKGLQVHGAKWAEKVSPWLKRQLSAPKAAGQSSAKPRVTGPTPRLSMPGTEHFTVGDRPAFVFLPKLEQRSRPQPWVFYAPTLPGYPDGAERWMHEQFLQAGVAVAGVDVGEAYGSPKSHAIFDALHEELTTKRGFAEKPCLLGRSRGGLWASSWAIARPQRAAGLAGIYPVFDFRTYPGLKNAAPAFGLAPAELEARVAELNPAARLDVLARARLPVLLVHGDMDTVVPLKENSGELMRRYEEAGAGTAARLIVLPGQGHNFFEGFFQSQELVDFVIARARAGAAK